MAPLWGARHVKVMDIIGNATVVALLIVTSRFVMMLFTARSR